MGDEADQEMVDACDSESELQIKRLSLSSPTNGELRNGDAPAVNQEAVLEIVISVYQTQGQQPCTPTYNIQDGSSFTRFIEGLRNLLAEHQEPEHLYDHHPKRSSSRKHPLLAKPRGDQQLERWIEVKLQVSGQGKGASSSSSTSLVIRDDNVDVVGFMNEKGDWYDIGNNLPSRYNSKPLAGWVINKEQVVNVLVGKTFAADAVRALSCYPEHVAGGVGPSLAFVGLSVMVCGSARMEDPVLKTIADGWDTGTRLPEKFMTDTVRKYEWKPDPAESDLQAVCLELNGPPEVVYTIGDEVSFISFMMDLRRMISNRPVRKDILDGHKDRNLSSTHEHPLLPQQSARHPERWLHVKLQVVEGEETSWTTLIMRDDNLYVNGFMNQQGVVYGLIDRNQNSVMLLPDPYMNLPVTRLRWSVEYISLLKAQSNDNVVKKLEAAHLGRAFAIEAVRILSRYDPSHVAAGDDKPRLALAGLIFMVCESARMNPLHNAFARGWSTGTGFTEELMNLHVWNKNNYSNKSSKLRDWKDNRYVESPELPHPIKELQDVYLVLNTIPKSKSSRSPPSPSPGSKPPPPPPPPGSNPPPPPPTGSPSTPYPATSSTTRATGVGSTGGGSGSGPKQPGEAGNDTGSSSGSASQPGNAGDAGSAFQPGDEGHSSLSRGNSGSQSQDAYNDSQGYGRPLVELLAIRADLRVVGTKIIVYDGIRGQIIYRKEEQRKHIKEQKEQGEQAMVELVLIGPYTCISAYGCFAIQIDIPDGAAGSSKGDASGLVDWEWDCYDPKYGEEVDKGPVTRTISSSGPGRNVEVTYAVMSNALEATVQVRLRLKDGHSRRGIINGEITADIDDFKDEDKNENKHKSVLFKRQSFSNTNDNSWFLLELARNVVAVPCGSALHIEVKLQIETDDSKEPELLNVPLSFENGICSSKSKTNDDGNEVEVEVTWYPELEETREEIDDQPEVKLPTEAEMMSGKLVQVVHTIGDEVSFTRFITDLRRILAKHPDQEDILDLSPLLSKQHAEQPARWLHINLQVVKGKEMSSATLVLRDDNLYVCGFINQNGVVYKLVDNNENSESFLPQDEEHHTTTYLQLGVNYKSLLQAKDRDEIVRKLTGVKLGRDFTMDAVRVLSGHPNKVDGINISTGLALAGLIVIFCESARMQPIYNAFKVGWKEGKALNKQLMDEYVWKYVEMSRKLQAWKSRNYTEPHCTQEQQATSLVLNTGRLPDDYTHGDSRQRVELLAIRADLGVIGKKIIVLDGKRGQIIYRHEKQGEQGRMVDLVLTGPYTGISCYGCFAIKIDTRDAAPIKWEWNCYDQKYAAEVDGPPCTHTIYSPANGDSSQKVALAEVTYAVMSNAREATVQVMLRLKEGPSPGGISGGKITAHIDGFEDKDKYRSVLFNSSESISTGGDSWLTLQLSRDVVAVPCCRLLQIAVDLQIKTSNDQSVNYSHSFNFYNNGVCSSRSHKDDHGSEVQVNITWYPELKTATEVVYTVGDVLSYTEFIAALRRILADHPDREDVLDEHPKFSSLSSTGEHPVLAKQRAEQPARWVHVKLQAVKGEEMLSTTLIMRDDNLYVCGFMNHQGNSFELIENPDRSAGILPVDEYNPQGLSWGVGYRSLLDVDTEYLVRRLAGVTMAHDFAMDAVHMLSCFPAWVDDRIRMNPRFALAGLIFIVCESARMKPIYDFFTSSWSWSNEDDYMEFLNTESIQVLVRDYVLNKYGRMSRELLAWKSRRYAKPLPIRLLRDIYLVLNYRLDPPHHQAGGAESSSSRFMDPIWSRHRNDRTMDRPRVELLAMRADLGVRGTTVIVFDGKRGHIIYRKKQEEKGKMVDLVLTGPCTSISAYGCFAIKIDIPAEDAGSSKGGASGSIKWEWDCYDPEYAKEVDQGPMTRTISSSGPGRNVEVTYAVMTNAVETTVQVKLRMKDGNSTCSVHGDITACIIGDFEHPSILFSRTKKTAQDFSPMTDSPQVVLYQLVRSLKLDRNVVAVPACGQILHIKVDLRIETSKNQGGASINPCFLLSFYDNRRWSSQRREVDGCEVEVIVAWSLHPSSDEYFTVPWEENKSMREADISYMVGNDADGFSTFITELRSLVADHPRCRDLMADHPDLSSTRDHKVLRKGKHRIQPENLFHIKLEAEAEEGVEETSSIILVMRYDNLDVIGFIINLQDRPSCYWTAGSRWELPGGYNNSTFLYWDKYYRREQTDDILGPARLGKTFAAEAVRELSRFKNREPSEEAKRSLVGLMIMVCDSARMEPVREAIAGGWVNGTELTRQLNNYNRRNWEVISGALLDWRDHAYQGWPQNTELESIGIKSSDKALEVVSLVFNDRNRICPPTAL